MTELPGTAGYTRPCRLAPFKYKSALACVAISVGYRKACFGCISTDGGILIVERKLLMFSRHPEVLSSGNSRSGNRHLFLFSRFSRLYALRQKNMPSTVNRLPSLEIPSQQERD